MYPAVVALNVSLAATLVAGWAFAMHGVARHVHRPAQPSRPS